MLEKVSSSIVLLIFISASSINPKSNLSEEEKKKFLPAFFYQLTALLWLFLKQSRFSIKRKFIFTKNLITNQQKS